MAAIEYSKKKWEEIHPHEEAFFGNVLHSGKRRAVLEYLGYRKLDARDFEKRKIVEMSDF